MKSLVSTVLFFGSFTAFCADLIVPRTSTEQIDNEPLNVGAVAYRLSADGDAADLVIGGERGTKVQVIDRTGIHGFRERPVAHEDFVVTHSAGIIFDVNTDTYRVDMSSTAQFGVTNWVKCTVAVGQRMGTVSRVVTNSSQGDFIAREVGSVSERIDGNEWTMTLVWDKTDDGSPLAGTLSVANIQPTVIVVGTKDLVNDLVTTEFQMRDTLGVLALGKWREWTRDAIGTASYEHWANAPATNNVSLAGKSIVFDRNGRYQMLATSSSNLAIQAGGIQGMEFDFHGVPLSGSLRITGFSYNNGVATVEYNQDIDGFDPNDLVVQETSSLTSPISWRNIPAERIQDLTDHGFRIVGISGPQGFYRINYHGEQSAVLTIQIRGQLNVTGDIGWNGTTLTQALGDIRAGTTNLVTSATNGVAYQVTTEPIPATLTNTVSYLKPVTHDGETRDEDENGAVVIGKGAVGTVDPDYIRSLTNATGTTYLRSMSVAIGMNAKARPDGNKSAQAIAIGANAKAEGSNAIAIGAGAVHWYEDDETGPAAVAKGSQAIALGYNAKAKASNAMQIGSGVNTTKNSLKFGDVFVVKDGKVQGGGADTNTVRDIVSDELDPALVTGPSEEITVKSHAITTYSPTNGTPEEVYITPTGTRNYEIYLPNTAELRAGLPIQMQTEIEGVTKLGPWWTNKVMRLPAKVTMKEPLPKTLILEVVEYADGWDWTPAVVRAFETNGAVRIEGANLHFSAAARIGGVVHAVKNPLYGVANVPTNVVVGASGALLGKSGETLCEFTVE